MTISHRFKYDGMARDGSSIVRWLMDAQIANMVALSVPRDKREESIRAERAAVNMAYSAIRGMLSTLVDRKNELDAMLMGADERNMREGMEYVRDHIRQGGSPSQDTEATGDNGHTVNGTRSGEGGGGDDNGGS